MPQTTVSIQIDIPQDVHDALGNHIKGFRKPPRTTEGGETIIEPMFRSVADYLAEILKVNIGKVLAETPTPQVEQLRAEIDERQKQIEAIARPAVTVRNP